MANLIITIISIALVAVAAVMGAYYGGTAFLNNTAQIRANKFLNEVHQVYAASTEYMLDNGLSSFGSDFSVESVYGGKYLPERPPIAGQPAVNGTYGAMAGEDVSCAAPNSIVTLDGEPVFMARGIFQNNGKNVVGILLGELTGGSADCGQVYAWGIDLSLATSANLPLVKMALAINKTMGLPAGLNLAPSGLPYASDGTPVQSPVAPGGAGAYAGYYINGSDKFNYCYIFALSGSYPYMVCDFTN